MEVKVDADELCELRAARNPKVYREIVYHGTKHYEDLLAAKDKQIADNNADNSKTLLRLAEVELDLRRRLARAVKAFTEVEAAFFNQDF